MSNKGHVATVQPWEGYRRDSKLKLWPSDILMRLCGSGSPNRSQEDGETSRPRYNGAIHSWAISRAGPIRQIQPAIEGITSSRRYSFTIASTLLFQQAARPDQVSESPRCRIASCRNGKAAKQTRNYRSEEIGRDRKCSET